MSSPYVYDFNSMSDKYKIAGGAVALIILGILVYYFVYGTDTIKATSSAFMPTVVRPILERPSHEPENFVPDTAVKRGVQWKSQGVATESILNFGRMDKLEDERLNIPATYNPETPDKDLEHMLRQ